jgi:beta-barrel assembly-enhancing protease
MKKLIFQGFALIVIFTGLFILIKQLPWNRIIPIDTINKTTEKKLGSLIIESIQSTHEESDNIALKKTIDSLFRHICEKNDVKDANIKLHLLESSEVNAFALPDAHMVIFTGLIKKTKNPEALCGVMAHELAHIEHHHVMQKLLKEIGLNTLLSITTGGRSGGMVQETAKVLSSTAFDRGLEEEADTKAVEYLINAEINALPFSDFLEDLSKDEPEALKYFKWVSTHPESKERAIKIRQQYRRAARSFEPLLTEKIWNALKQE